MLHVELCILPSSLEQLQVNFSLCCICRAAGVGEPAALEAWQARLALWQQVCS